MKIVIIEEDDDAPNEKAAPLSPRRGHCGKQGGRRSDEDGADQKHQDEREDKNEYFCCSSELLSYQFG